MKIAVVVCVLCFSVALSEAAIAKAQFYNPSYENKCYIDEKNIYSAGEEGKAPNNPCAGFTCLGKNGYVEFRTCPPMAPSKGCKLRGFVNTNRPFPDCCERTFDCTPKI